jgi:hypothetical protein
MRQENRWEVEGFGEGASGGRDGGAVLHDGLIEIRIRVWCGGWARARSYEDGGEGNRGGGDLSLIVPATRASSGATTRSQRAVLLSIPKSMSVSVI